MDKKYRILWIDDEHEELSGFKAQAKLNGIILTAFRSLNAGLNEIETNPEAYDGILLDAKFVENEDDDGTEDTLYVHRAKDRILQLDKKFELFILTGQAEAYKDKTFKKAFVNVYQKGNSEDVGKLFIALKTAADKQEDTQLRHGYKRVFDVCTGRYIGEESGARFLKLLKVRDDNIGTEEYFNTLRKIIEDLFVAFNQHGLLPDSFVENGVALNPSSQFLSGDRINSNNYSHYNHLEETHLPTQIAYYLKSILFAVQNGSHSDNDIIRHVKTVNTPYLYKSILYQLMDVIVWFKIYIDSEPPQFNWSE